MSASRVLSFCLVAVLALSLPGCVSKHNMERAAAQADLGAAYYKEGNPEAAVEALRHAKELDPRSSRAMNLLAISLLSKGLPDEAEVEFKKALRVNPNEAEILVNYGAMKLRQGKTTEAIAMFTKAMNDLEYRNVALLLSDLSLAYTADGQYDKAVSAAREATRRMPTLCQGWFNLGTAEEKAGHADDAIAAYASLIENCPTESDGARVRVACLQAQGPTPDEGLAALRDLVVSTRGTPLGDQARACLTGS